MWVGAGKHRECVKDDMKEQGIKSEWVVFTVQGYVENPHIGKNLAERGRNERFKNE